MQQSINMLTLSSKNTQSSSSISAKSDKLTNVSARSTISSASTFSTSTATSTTALNNSSNSKYLSVVDIIVKGGDEIGESSSIQGKKQKAPRRTSRRLSDGASNTWSSSNAQILEVFRYELNDNGEETYMTRLINDLKSAFLGLHLTVGDDENENANIISDEKIEQLAMLINDSMSANTRYYHNMQHIFDISDGVDSIQLLSSFFQDLVYYNVDDGLINASQQNLVSDIVTKTKDNNCYYISFNKTINENDDDDGDNDDENNETDNDDQLLIGMIMSIFDLQTGDVFDPFKTTTTTGSSSSVNISHVKTCMNEFLSAVVTGRLLKDMLPIKYLIQVITCIEATQPFRRSSSPSPTRNEESSIIRRTSSFDNVREESPLLRRRSMSFDDKDDWEDSSSSSSENNNNNDKSPMDSLRDKLSLTNSKYNIGLTEAEITKAIQRAADTSNRNCGSFANCDLGSFLDRTWSLLPEITPELRKTFLYTLYDLHKSVCDMEKFFTNLDISTIFVSYQGSPPSEEMNQFVQRASINIDLAKRYIRAHVVSYGILAAFAELTGGNVPTCYFMGDLPSKGKNCSIDNNSNSRFNCSFSNGLDCGNGDNGDSAVVLVDDCNMQVYDILMNGRNTDNVDFDVQESPLAGFVYGMVGDSFLLNNEGITMYASYPMTKDKANNLLSILPINVVVPIGKHISEIAIARTELINKILNNLLEIDQHRNKN